MLGGGERCIRCIRGFSFFSKSLVFIGVYGFVVVRLENKDKVLPWLFVAGTGAVINCGVCRFPPAIPSSDNVRQHRLIGVCVRVAHTRKWSNVWRPVAGLEWFEVQWIGASAAGMLV